jgi:hypothetical protein
MRRELDRIAALAEKLSQESPTGEVSVSDLAKAAGLTDHQAQLYVGLLLQERGWVPEALAPPETDK